MPYPLPLTRTEAYLAYKAGVVQLSDLKPSLAKPRIGIDDWLAYWTGLKNDYPKNPDGTPKMLQEEEKYIAYLSGVTNTYPEKCLRRVGAYLRYLISARWGRPDHPLNREELYLSLIKTQFIPSGDPSTDIVIDGTAKAPFVDVKMYGDTFQQSYTGKNLFNDATATNSYIQSNGSVTPNDVWRASQLIKVEPNTSYTWHGDVYGAHQLVWAGYNSSQAFISGQYAQVNNVDSLRIITGENTGYIRVGYRSDGMRNMQLELGSTASDYEPYVGGQPSPSPEYPQQIQTVTGEQTVTVSGKNLFDDSVTPVSDTLTPAGVSWLRANDGTITTSGTNSGAYRFIRYEITLPAGNYWFGGCPSGGSTDGYSMIVQTDYSNPNTIVFDTGSGNTFTLAQQTTIQVFPIRIGSQTVNMDGKVFKPIIVAGSTATDYVPYSSTDYPISLGSIELCKLDTYQDYIYKDGDSWKVHKATATITLTGASSENWYVDQYAYMLNNVISAKAFSDIANMEAYCRSFSKSATGQTSSYVVSFWYNAPGTSVRFIKDQTPDLSSFRNWLASNNQTVYYPLATATDTTITDTTLIAQLEALKNGGAENGTTYIKVNATDPNLPGLLYVEAPKYE